MIVTEVSEFTRSCYFCVTTNETEALERLSKLFKVRQEVTGRARGQAKLVSRLSRSVNNLYLIHSLLGGLRTGLEAKVLFLKKR